MQIQTQATRGPGDHQQKTETHFRYDFATSVSPVASSKANGSHDIRTAESQLKLEGMAPGSTVTGVTPGANRTLRINGDGSPGPKDQGQTASQPEPK